VSELKFKGVSRPVVGMYSRIFECKVNNPCEGCRWFRAYSKPYSFGEVMHIGWCARFEPDPDAGYIAQGKNPPCLTWDYEPVFSKGAEDEPR
jgi:hypothetical protein